MREIKYRAWNKEWGMLLPVDNIIFENGLAVEVRVTIKASDYNHQDEWQDYRIGDEIILQQYTGLNDKNGKEIYEGDILKLTSIYFLFYDLFTVGFNKGSFTFKNKEEHYFKNYIGNRKEDLIIEVIGNIYENKDLIK